MNKRTPMSAGTFYEKSPDACRAHAMELIESVNPPDDLPKRIYGGLVPHAGWVFSGALAAMTFKALLRRTGTETPETVVLFGADHTGAVHMGEVWDTGSWGTPVGDVQVDETLAGELLKDGDENLLRSNPAAHVREHSLEVQVPLLVILAPQTKIVPIAVPPTDEAVRIGRTVGKHLSSLEPGRVCVVGSTDLTHHGGHFGSPGGRGQKSEAYARQNDRRMLDMIEAMDAESVIPEARNHMNACGAGAIAAAIAAVREMGARAGRVLGYTNSYEIVHKKAPHAPDDTAVGYASVVFV